MAKVNAQDKTSASEYTVLNKQSNVLKIRNEKHLSNNFRIVHQNISGILHKTDKLLISLLGNSPQVLRISEHHLCIDEINNINFSPYTLGAQYCRQHCKKAGVAIFVTNNIQFNIIDLRQFSKEKDLEVCALRISLLQENLIVACIYRSPKGDFQYFIKQL